VTAAPAEGALITKGRAKSEISAIERATPIRHGLVSCLPIIAFFPFERSGLRRQPIS